MTRAADLRRQLDQEDGRVQAGILRWAKRTEAEERLRLVAMGPDGPELRATAFHEAGHAIVAHLEGAGIRRVVVKVREALPWESAGGGLRVDGGSFWPRRPAWYTTRATVAGLEAELLAGFPEGAARAASHGDLRKVRPDREATDRTEARAILRRHWPAVRALAEALVRWGELEGEEAVEIIR